LWATLLPHFGEPKDSKLEFLRTGDSTHGKYLYVVATVPPGSGPPPHIHHWTDEWFYTPDGGAVLFMGTKEYSNLDNPPDRGEERKDTLQLMPMEEGELIYGPRNKIHGYVNATDKPLKMHIIWTPDTPETSILGYFKKIYEPLFSNNNLNSRFNVVQQIMAVSTAKQYGMNFSNDFWQFADDVRYVRPHGDKKLDKLMALIREGDKP
jgi:oxalate decarboxylase/phosphoglucose isomerase-like protein (cupin superfamily)